MSFTLRLTLALLVGVAAAIVISPLAAWAIAAIGLRFPFPRIFDRTVMVTLGLVIVYDARALGVVRLLRSGFLRPAAEIGRALRGFIVAVAAIATLCAAAALFGALPARHLSGAFARLPKYLLSGIAVGIIEEGFFRAILFGGMREDFGRMPALIASSAIYALAHLVRSPAHFYVTGLVPLAGLRNVAGSTAQFADPATALPTLAGLFLLGIVLAAAYVVTGTVYFSIGLHGGLVVGAKLWPHLVRAHSVPGWLEGWGRLPLISGAGAWALTIAILLMLRPLAGPAADDGAAD
jgi:CAAX protease family protein